VDLRPGAAAAAAEASSPDRRSRRQAAQKPVKVSPGCRSQVVDTDRRGGGTGGSSCSAIAWNHLSRRGKESHFSDTRTLGAVAAAAARSERDRDGLERWFNKCDSGLPHYSPLLSAVSLSASLLCLLSPSLGLEAGLLFFTPFPRTRSKIKHVPKDAIQR
jgi:hypothetical protein